MTAGCGDLHHMIERIDLRDHRCHDEGASCFATGFVESANETFVAYELESLGLEVERQNAVPVIHKDVKLECDFRADLLAKGVVVLELKVKEALYPFHTVQFLPHFRLLKLSFGRHINFHVVDLSDGIDGVVNNFKE